MEMELVVDTVLVLSLPFCDERDCGLPLPRFASVSDMFDVFELEVLFVPIEDILKGEGDDVGLLTRLRALSLSLVGDGVKLSSMINTQPDVSPL